MVSSLFQSSMRSFPTVPPSITKQSSQDSAITEFSMEFWWAWQCRICRKAGFPWYWENFHFLSKEFSVLSAEFPFSECRISIFWAKEFWVVCLDSHCIFECKTCNFWVQSFLFLVQTFNIFERAEFVFFEHRICIFLKHGILVGLTKEQEIPLQISSLLIKQFLPNLRPLLSNLSSLAGGWPNHF